jgi:mRNA-degrading endonuclease RelE of RelBE toxin-antitoxin system
VPQNSQEKLQVFWNNFVEIHKTFLENLKTKHLNDEQKALFSEKEQEVLEKFEEYKSKAKSIFQEYSQK